MSCRKGSSKSYSTCAARQRKTCDYSTDTSETSSDSLDFTSSCSCSESDCFDCCPAPRKRRVTKKSKSKKLPKGTKAAMKIATKTALKAVSRKKKVARRSKEPSSSSDYTTDSYSSDERGCCCGAKKG